MNQSYRNVMMGGLLAGGALLAATAGVSIADAQDSGAPPSESSGWHGEGHWHGHHGGLWHLYKQLGLSDEQKASIKAILQAAAPQMKTLHQQMRANQEKLMQATPGSATYSTVVDEVAQTNATLASHRTTEDAELQAQIYQVLTPAQQAQLATLKAQWAAKIAAHQAAQ